MTWSLLSIIPQTRAPSRNGMLAALCIGWRAMRRHHRRRRQLVALSRMPPRLLRDMGLEPERVYETLDGTSDEVGPAHFSRLLRGAIER